MDGVVSEFLSFAQHPTVERFYFLYSQLQQQKNSTSQDASQDATVEILLADIIISILLGVLPNCMHLSINDCFESVESKPFNVVLAFVGPRCYFELPAAVPAQVRVAVREHNRVLNTLHRGAKSLPIPLVLNRRSRDPVYFFSRRGGAHPWSLCLPLIFCTTVDNIQQRTHSAQRVSNHSVSISTLAVMCIACNSLNKSLLANGICSTTASVLLQLRQ